MPQVPLLLAVPEPSLFHDPLPLPCQLWIVIVEPLYGVDPSL